MVAVGEWNLRSGGCAKRRTNAGNHLYRHASSAARFGFFAAPSENEGVTTFEADNIVTIERLTNEQRIDGVLIHCVPRSCLGHRYQARAVPCHRKDFRCNQAIVNDNAGRHEQPCGAQCQQIGIARAGTDKVNRPDPGAGRRGLHRMANAALWGNMPAIMP